MSWFSCKLSPLRLVYERETDLTYAAVGLPGVFWLYMYWGEYFSSPKKVFLAAINFSLIGVGTTICACGLWVSGLAIHQDSTNSSGGSFSCANNA